MMYPTAVRASAYALRHRLQDEVNIKLISTTMPSKAYRLARIVGHKTLITSMRWPPYRKRCSRRELANMDAFFAVTGRSVNQYSGGDARQTHGRQEGDRRDREPRLYQSWPRVSVSIRSSTRNWLRRRTSSASRCQPTCRRSSV